MNWKGYGKERRENHENLSQDSRSPCRDLKSGPSEYDSEVLTTRTGSRAFLVSLHSNNFRLKPTSPKVFRIRMNKQTSYNGKCYSRSCLFVRNALRRQQFKGN
jgi:hypothetical protein